MESFRILVLLCLCLFAQRVLSNDEKGLVITDLKTPILTIIKDDLTSDILVGGENQIFKLNKDMEIISCIKQSMSVKNQCPSLSWNIDSYVLLIDYETRPSPNVISCGVAGGMCSLHRYSNLSDYGIFGRRDNHKNRVISQPPPSSGNILAFAFTKTDRKKFLFVTSDEGQLHLSMRSMDLESEPQMGVIMDEHHTIKDKTLVYGFKRSGNVFLVLGGSDLTNVIRIYYDLIDGYLNHTTEIPISCVSGNDKKISAAYLLENPASQEDYLYVVMSLKDQNTALCRYKLRSPLQRTLPSELVTTLNQTVRGLAATSQGDSSIIVIATSSGTIIEMIQEYGKQAVFLKNQKLKIPFSSNVYFDEEIVIDNDNKYAFLTLGENLIRYPLSSFNVIEARKPISLAVIAVPLFGVLFTLTVTIIYVMKRNQNQKRPRSRPLSCEDQSPINKLEMRERKISEPKFIIDPELLSELNEANRLIPRELVTIKDLIGEGFFGYVFEGELNIPYLNRKQKIAVKTLRQSTIITCPTHAEMFVKEALVMKDFNHPHVIHLVGFSLDHDGSPFVLLPFMENGNLLDFLRDPEESLCIGHLLQFAFQIAKVSIPQSVVSTFIEIHCLYLPGNGIPVITEGSGTLYLSTC